jgi:pyruvate formate lyase activating enzyme
MISRREFLTTLARYSAILGGAGMILSDPFWQMLLSGDESGLALAGNYLDEIVRSAPRARYWTSPAAANVNCSACHGNLESIKGTRYAHKENIIKCLLCAHGCVIRNGQRGRCRTRMNVNGELRSLVYGRPISIHVDPIEKKPFYHFLPGAEAYSLATAGCPFRCKFCQNWEISQARPEDAPNMRLLPQEVVDQAINRQIPTIAYTYSEPTVWYDYMYDIAKLAREKNVNSVVVSNGFIEKQPLADLLPYLSAYKIDLKSIREDYYRNVVRGELKPVQERLVQVRSSGVLLEIVNLVVPTLNDSEDDFRQLARWVKSNLGPDVPVHFSAFHPDCQMLDKPRTPHATLAQARNIARKNGLRYVFTGNVSDIEGGSTYCHACGKLLIGRDSYILYEWNLTPAGACKFCGTQCAGVFQAQPGDWGARRQPVRLKEFKV